MVQRIIFSGRVLKDEDTLETSGITDGVQVHLVSINRNQGGSAGGAPAANPASSEPAPQRSAFIESASLLR